MFIYCSSRIPQSTKSFNSINFGDMKHQRVFLGSDVENFQIHYFSFSDFHAEHLCLGILIRARPKFLALIISSRHCKSRRHLANTMKF